MQVTDFQITRFIDEQKASMIEKAFSKKNFQSLESFSKAMKLQKEEDFQWMTNQEYAQKLLSACHELHYYIELEKKQSKKRIEASSIEKLKDTADIVEVIGNYIQLKKAGSSYEACCPFHGEKTPSFKVSPSRNTYHCFGCGVSGDSINFVMEYNSRSFPEAVEEVAAISNYTLQYEDGSELEYQPYQRKERLEKPFEFQEFNSEKEYKQIDFELFIPKFSKMDDDQKAKMIFTAIYTFSRHTTQWGKEKFYRGRGIDLKADNQKTRQIKNEIGYLYKTDIPVLVKLLEEDFGAQTLREFGITSQMGEFIHQTAEGFCVIPSYDLYSNMITGLKLRNTKLFDWQSKNLKEPEMSAKRVANPLPFALTREHMLDESLSFRMFEGSVDMLSIPEKEGFVDIAIPGVTGIRKEQLGLFRNRLVELWFDQDRAGRRAVYGYFIYKLKSGRKIRVINKGLNKELLDVRYKQVGRKIQGMKELLIEAGATVKVVQWSKKIGSDVNEVLQNGNIVLLKDC